MVQVPTLLTYNVSSVHKGLKGYIGQVRISFRVIPTKNLKPKQCTKKRNNYKKEMRRKKIDFFKDVFFSYILYLHIKDSFDI